MSSFNERYCRAGMERVVPTSTRLEHLKRLEGLSDEEQVAMKEILAQEIEETCPYKPGRDPCDQRPAKYAIVPVFPDIKNAPVYLFGEAHTDQLCYEAELWMLRKSYDRGLRHLIYEMASYAAAEINLWMKAEDDTILNQLMKDWQGTLGAAPNHYAWFKEVKKHCPELIFHGVDIDGFYDTTGARHLARLEGQVDSQDYKDTMLTMTLGQSWHDGGGGVNFQREYYMFCGCERELETLWKSEPNARVFGIFGRFHVDINQKNNLIALLRKKYGEVFQIWQINGHHSVEQNAI